MIKLPAIKASASGVLFGLGRKNSPAYGAPREGLGPMIWCKTCSRKHRRRDVCNLFLRTRTAKSGRKVKRWCH